MRFIQAILFSFILFLNLEAASSLPILPKAVEEMMQQSKSLRLKPHLSEDEELLRQTLLLEQLMRDIPDYGDHESLEPVFDLLLRGEINLHDFVVINSKLTPFFGQSHDEVYFVENAKGDLLFVIKAFHDPDSVIGKFLPELSAMALLRERQMETLITIDPVAIGKCCWHGKRYGVLVQTVAPGMRVDQFLFEINAFSPGTIERKEIMRKAVRLFERIGKSFAELHEGPKSTVTALSKRNLRTLQVKFKALLDEKTLALIEDKIDLEALKTEVDRVSQEVARIKFVACFQHGDANIKNIFYDEISDLIIFIDVSRLHRSIDYNGNPLMDGVYDLIYLQESLICNGIGILSDEEIKNLLEVFFKSYEVHGSLLDERLVYYYTFVCKLRSLINNSDFPNVQDPHTQRQHRLIFESSLRYFQDILKPVSVSYEKK